ncbi:MAG: 1-acyl-sn-glycerol-3-phosphate acyltransferase [FCB group bacterium]|nr:1-acyl-sn-glycerol-3-phosphate acyltransferase [FCB group bacterium]
MMDWFYRFIWSLVKAFGWVIFGLRQVGAENIPRTGPIIIASNHQSNLDPPFVAVTIPREMHFFAKKELFDILIMGRIISRLNAIPVRRGVYDPKALNLAFGALENGGGLILYPEGTRGNGREFLKPKPGVGLIAKRSKATIVPTYAYRTNRLGSALFWRKRLKVFFGPPISAEEIDKYEDDKSGYQALAEEVMRHIAGLKAIATGDKKTVKDEVSTIRGKE